MTDLDQAVLTLLCARWQAADEIVEYMPNVVGSGRYKGDWTPGAVLASLERLAVAGKAEFDLARGWRIMPERPAKVDQQKGLFA